jgi:hypothetical protein
LIVLFVTAPLIWAAVVVGIMQPLGNLASKILIMRHLSSSMERISQN